MVRQETLNHWSRRTKTDFSELTGYVGEVPGLSIEMPPRTTPPSCVPPKLLDVSIEVVSWPGSFRGGLPGRGGGGGAMVLSGSSLIVIGTSRPSLVVAVFLCSSKAATNDFAEPVAFRVRSTVTRFALPYALEAAGATGGRLALTERPPRLPPVPPCEDEGCGAGVAD